jgi:hypothetical protein
MSSSCTATRPPKRLVALFAARMAIPDPNSVLPKQKNLTAEIAEHAEN